MSDAQDGTLFNDQTTESMGDELYWFSGALIIYRLFFFFFKQRDTVKDKKK